MEDWIKWLEVSFPGFLTSEDDRLDLHESIRTKRFERASRTLHKALSAPPLNYETFALRYHRSTIEDLMDRSGLSFDEIINSKPEHFEYITNVYDGAAVVADFVDSAILAHMQKALFLPYDLKRQAIEEHIAALQNNASRESVVKAFISKEFLMAASNGITGSIKEMVDSALSNNTVSWETRLSGMYDTRQVIVQGSILCPYAVQNATSEEKFDAMVAMIDGAGATAFASILRLDATPQGILDAHAAL